jgi:hypothetical protein
MIRTTRPTSSDKYYITKSKGGYSTCIKGKPTDSQCDVLANCVGYACGAANEELNLGYEKYHLNCNAENFIERAIAAGLTVTKTPTLGAIACWEGKGSLAGHVAICVEVVNSNCCKFAQSGYGASKPFWVATHYNNNGRWGLSADYPFRGFIIIPGIEPPTPITPPVARDTSKDQLITNMEMNVRLGIETTSKCLGIVPKGNIYNYYDVKQGKNSKWYAISPDKSQWIAGVNNNGTKYCDIKPKEQPAPTPTPEPPKPTGLKVGDKVKIVGTGNGSSYGDSNTAYGIGWTREILRIWSNRLFPYQVGNNTGTTGFYKENALKKL